MITSHQPSVHSNRILIVEDAIDIRQLLQQLFELEGYTVDVASNGMEALTLLQSQSELPRVILLDLMMPVMDGFQFRELQVKDPRLASIPVLLMTADANIVTKTQKLGKPKDI